MVSQEDMAPLPGRLSYPKCSTKGQYETCLQKRMDGAQHGHGFEWNCAPCHNTTNLLYDANVQVYRDYTLYTAYKCVCYMCFYESICTCVLCLCVCPSHQHNSCSQRSRLLTHPFELVQWPHQEHCATHKSVFNTLYIMHPCDIDAINYVYIAHCVVINKSVWSNMFVSFYNESKYFLLNWIPLNMKLIQFWNWIWLYRNQFHWKFCSMKFIQI